MLFSRYLIMMLCGSALLVAAIAGDLRSEPAETDYPNDPLFYTNTADDASLRQIAMSAEGTDVHRAWQAFTTGDRGTLIAIADSGIDYDHEDLRNQIALNQGEVSAIALARGIAPNSLDTNGDGIISWRELSSPAAGVLKLPDDDFNGNGVLDRGDLTPLGDGIDNDGNGFIDDIAGYDFDDGDNDEFDHRYFGHGTGRAGIAAAEADNGIGIAGNCPRCSLLNIRSGDSYIQRGDLVAQAIVFAAVRGAASLNMSLGVIGESAFLRQAVDYAVNVKNTVLCNATANEYSYHHNLTAVLDDVLAVGSVKREPAHLIDGEPYFWTEKVADSNYGPHLFMVSPSNIPSTGMVSEVIGSSRYQEEGGTSSATPGVAGISALIASYGKDALSAGVIDSPLTAAEIRQLLRASATDVRENKWGAGKGFDQFTGYGRVNAYRALELVGQNKIPPVVDIESPRWYLPFVTGRGASIIIDGTVIAARADSFDWILEYGIGPNPEDSRPVDETVWTTIASGSGNGHIAGTLADWDADGVTPIIVTPPVAELPGPQSHQVTIRLRATDNNGNEGEDRVTIFIYEDKSLLPGFPLYLGASIEASPLITDCDGDGADEMYIATGDGTLLEIDEQANIVREFYTNPVTLGFTLPGDYNWTVPRSGIAGAPAAGDLNGDDLAELVVGATDGRIYAFDRRNAELLPGFPVEVGKLVDSYPEEADSRAEIYGAITLADIDGVPGAEIIVGAADSKVYVFDYRGKLVAGFPVLARDTAPGEYGSNDRTSIIFGSAAVGNIDGSTDGSPEIVVATSEAYGASSRLYAFDHNGKMLPGYPFKLPGLIEIAMGAIPLIGAGTASSPVLADLDRDGDLEILVAPFSAAAPIIYHHDGYEYLRLKTAGNDADSRGELLAIWVNGTATFGDINGDGEIDVFVPMLGPVSLGGMLLGGTRVNHFVYGWNAETGELAPNFPIPIEDWQMLINYALADIDGNGLPELIAGSGGYYLHAYNSSGREPAGWPKLTGGWIIGSPAVGDLDGDGTIEVVAATREGYIFVYHADGQPKNIQWKQYQFDAAHTGNFDITIGPPKKKDQTGCSVSSENNSSAIVLILALILLAGFRYGIRNAAKGIYRN